MKPTAGTHPTSVLVRRIATTTPSPWRNGGGQTRRLLTGRSADGTTVASSPWTLSLADLTGAVSFSRFEGMERTLLLVRESPLQLRVDGHVRTVAPFELLRFPGEADVELSWGHGHGHALNLMTRRSTTQASLSVHLEVPVPPSSGPVLGSSGPAPASPAALVVLRAGSGYAVGDTVVLPGGAVHLTEEPSERTPVVMDELPTPVAGVHVSPRL